MKLRLQRADLAILGAVVSLLMGQAWACSCLPYPDDARQAVTQAWDQADAILSGEVTDQRPVSRPGFSDSIEVTIAVARRWKGPTGQQLTIRTSTSSASCGYAFETGAQYLIFASRDGESTSYSTGLCSLTRPLEEARALVRVLDARVEAK